jgi:hypothetical protein
LPLTINSFQKIPKIESSGKTAALWEDSDIGRTILSWVELILRPTVPSTSSFWYRAPLWGPWPEFILILSLVTVALLFFL